MPVSLAVPMPLARRALLALTATATAAVTSTAQAQPAWPSRPLRLVVPFPAGSTPDLAARAVALHFAQVFGQPCVVDNRAGGGGGIGTEAIARATDDHTIGVSIGGPASTAKLVNPALGYDPALDLAPVSLLVRMPLVLAVHPAVPARDMAEFTAHAKANPGLMNYASVGAGTLGHLAIAELAARHGLEMTHVPFRSLPQGVTEMVAGRIQLMAVATGAVLPQLREGLVRALAISSEQRFAAAPEIATLTEQREGAAIWTWVGLFAPRSIPTERLARLATEARHALAEPQAVRTLTTAGFEVVASAPDDFASFILAEIARWGPLISRLGIRPDS